MLREMVDLGFPCVELSHGIRVSLVPGILKAVEEGWVEVASVHNFCPLPTSVIYPAPNFYEPTSSNVREVRQWIRYTQQTIEFARRVDARCVVVHLGSIRFWWRHPIRKLEAYRRGKSQGGLAEDRKYEDLVEKALERIYRRHPSYLKRVRARLDSVVPYAREHGVRLGIENREGLTELPIDREVTSLLADYPEGVGYWHDTGHAMIKENLGVHLHARHLQENSNRLIGFHLHDVDAEGRDHQPIGSGQVDFAMVCGFFRRDHLLVLELNPRLVADDVLASHRNLDRLIPANRVAP